MNRESLDKFCERGILGLVLAILVFTPLAFGGISQVPAGTRFDFILVNPFNIVQWLTVGVLLFWMLRLWADPRIKLLWPPICWAVVAFAAYAVIRFLTSDIEYVARQEMIQALVYTFLFFAIVNNLHRQECVQFITLTLVFLAMAISFYAIYQFVSGSNKVWCLTKPYMKRGSGTFISPNNLAGFLEMILPLGLAYTLTSRTKALTKVFVGYASLAIIAGIAVSASRGGWFATAIALLVFFVVLLFHHTHRIPALALLLVIVIGGFYFGPRNIFFKTRLQQIQDPNGGVSSGERFEIWHSAVQLWRENIWAGIGPAHFDYRFGKYRPASVQLSPDRVHNDYLNTLTDWGIIGVTLVAVPFILLYAGAFKTWGFVRRSANTLGDPRSNKLTIVLGTSVGLLALLIHSFVDFNMHIPANALLAVALMAFLTCYLRFATDNYWFTAKIFSKSLITLALAAGTIYLGWQAARLGAESVWLMRAQKTNPDFPDQKIAALQHAFSIEPKNPFTAQDIGEAFRLESWQNGANYKEEALEAMKWFKQAFTLNPYDDSSVLRYGICLDQIGEHEEAFKYIDKANLMDPNSYFNNAYMGWHYVQTGDYAAALTWFRRSREMSTYHDNPVASTYLEIALNKMQQAATNTSPLLLHPAPSPATNAPWNQSWDKK